MNRGSQRTVFADGVSNFGVSIINSAAGLPFEEQRAQDPPIRHTPVVSLR
jgi:hypothetical protein